MQTNTWIEPLAAREIQILGLISGGLSNRAIAHKLSLSLDTIKWYNQRIYRKLGVSNRAQAIKVAGEQNLLKLPTTNQAEEKFLSGNLPAQLTSFVGRENEIAQIRNLLRSKRLVVLTGAGGSGKTRLALQVAGELAENYRDGVWLVELASLKDPKLVPETIAQALKISLGASKSPTETLISFLRRKHLLLLLDNFEHLLEAAPLVGELLSAAARLSVLATSRERLHLYGEQEYPVRPLQLPDSRRSETPEKLLSYEAIDLFAQRARSARPGLELDEATLPAVAQICMRLDGLPLALELAASQVKLFPPPILAQQLEKDLDVLPDGPRDLPDRQRTLRATIEWSENLLEPQERTLFARLAVFSGGATLEAIEQVCSEGLKGKLITQLSALVDKNLLLERESQDGELRFSMLETIHEYAHERLLSGEEAQELQRRHADYYTDLANEANGEIRSSRQGYWIAILRREQDNLRSVLAWSIEGGDIRYALRLVTALQYYWHDIDNVAEGARWCDLILAKEPDAPPGLLAGALLTSGILSTYTHNVHPREDLLHRALELYRQSGDESGAAWTLSYLAVGIGFKSTDGARQGINLIKQSLEIFRKRDDQPGMAHDLNMLGELSRAIGDYEAAQKYYEESLQIEQLTGNRLDQAEKYLNLSYTAFHRNQYQLAVELLQQALVIFKEFGAGYGKLLCLAVLAGPTNELGDYEKAARLLGAADAAAESLDYKYLSSDQFEIDRFEISTRQALGEEAFEEAWQEGHGMSLEEVIEYALKDR